MPALRGAGRRERAEEGTLEPGASKLCAGSTGALRAGKAAGRDTAAASLLKAMQPLEMTG